jgi:ABC-type multidrug transport system ATPase subunit
LSTGNKKALSLALTFASFPDLIIIDEPGLGLDIFRRRHEEKLIKSLTNTKIAKRPQLMMATHDITEASNLGLKFGLILDGVLTAYSGVEEFILKNSRIHKLIIEK